MDSLKLYKALQTHVGELNRLTVKLGNGDTTADEAQAEAKAKTEALLTTLNESE